MRKKTGKSKSMIHSSDLQNRPVMQHLCHWFQQHVNLHHKSCGGISTKLSEFHTYNQSINTIPWFHNFNSVVIIIIKTLPDWSGPLSTSLRRPKMLRPTHAPTPTSGIPTVHPVPTSSNR
jgi:hypothetical protein